MSDKEQLTIFKFFCPRELCDCSKGGGRYLGQIVLEHGGSCLAELICPNRKSRPVAFAKGDNPPKLPKT